MDRLIAARAQMEVSLGFHMVFAALGIGMPLLMVIAEGMWLRTKKAHYRELARKWSKVTALLFAIGAVSGTALSFELGLLWPHFMELAGGAIGPAFALEGYAFFIEAIFVGLYLYGWERLSPRVHWLTGIAVAVSGMVSGVLVVAANAWMQVPSGTRIEDGHLVDADAMAAFESPVWPVMSVHSTLSCYIAVGFAAAGVYAFGVLRGKKDEYHRRGIDIALAVAVVAAVLQIVSGHASAQAVGEHEPVKLAAMEAHFVTARGVPIIVGGFPDGDTGQVTWALRIPKALSLLTKNDPNAEIRGLNDYPKDERPNVLVTHLAFDTMVGCGFTLALVGALFWSWRLWRWRRPGAFEPKALARLVVIASPLGFVALEAGWIVTEVGRQPWIVRGVMRTQDAVTPAASVPVSFVAFTVLYVLLAVVLVLLLRYLASGKPLRRADGASPSAHDVESASDHGA
jgi:cytochrome d ubiquinol oxidase subunit I